MMLEGNALRELLAYGRCGGQRPPRTPRLREVWRATPSANSSLTGGVEGNALRELLQPHRGLRYEPIMNQS